MKFTMFLEDTGQIVQIGECDSDLVELQLRDGMDIVIGHYDSNQFYWNGSSMQAMPPRPGEWYVWDYQQRQWIADTVTAAASVTAKRDSLLRGCDWTQMPDVPEATQLAWRPYRQALRDVTSQSGYPLNVTWPTAPQ